jgi:excisionase family DNA binding protein
MLERLLCANDIASQLKISRSKAYSLMKQGVIPIVRFGGNVRVRPEDLDKFIEQNCSSYPQRKLELAASTASPNQNMSPIGK